MDPHFCQDLSRIARKSLYGVLAFYRLGRPEQPVFAFHGKLLPETFLDSRASLYRGLKEAEDKGYIRREQVRTWGARCYGQFSRSHIYLLDKALVMLGLADPAAPSITPPEPERFADDGEHAPSAPSQASILEAWEDGRADWEDDETGWETDTPPQEPTTVTPYATYPQEPCLTVTHGIQESEPTLDLQLKGQLPTRESLPDPSSLKDSSENIDPHTRLPQDVTPLIKLGVSKTLICTLMAYAKRQGQQGQLGAAVKLFWQHIEGLRGRSVFAYLRKVLSQKRDYAHMLKQQSANQIDGVLTASARARLSEKLAVLLARGDGFQVRNAEGQGIGTLRANGETGYVEGFEPKRGRVALPANLRFMQAVEEGRLHLRPC
ncbi:replication protein [Thauera sp.]|uniref:replication protein n=1 Tax=Thauera sp. TaxID=1905334 RepID=UPI002619A664|nr:replication protein [Thauera sp.]